MNSGKPAGRKLFWTRIIFLVLGAAFITIGVARGDCSDVMNKAIHICYECIGIG